MQSSGDNQVSAMFSGFEPTILQFLHEVGSAEREERSPEARNAFDRLEADFSFWAGHAINENTTEGLALGILQRHLMALLKMENGYKILAAFFVRQHEAAETRTKLLESIFLHEILELNDRNKLIMELWQIMQRIDPKIAQGARSAFKEILYWSTLFFAPKSKAEMAEDFKEQVKFYFVDDDASKLESLLKLFIESNGPLGEEILSSVAAPRFSDGQVWYIVDALTKMIAKFDDGYIYLAKLLALNVDLLFKDDPFSERFGPIWESLGQVPGGRIKFAGAFAGVKELEESAQKYANNKYEEGEALPGMLTKIWLWLADNPDPSNAPAERLILRQIMNTDLRVLLLMMNIWLKDSTSCCNYLTVLGKQIEDVRKHTKTPVRQEMFITLMARLRELATQPAPDNARIAQGIFNLLSSCYKKEELAAAFIAGEKSGHAFEAVFIGDNGYKNLLALAIESDQINLAEVIIQAAQNIDVNLLPKMLEHCDKDGQTALSMIQKGDGRFNEIREMLGVSGKGCSIA